MRTERDAVAWGEGLAALFWRDGRAFANRVRQGLKDPKRVAVWGLFVLWIALAGISQVVGRSQGETGVRLPSGAGLAFSAVAPGLLAIAVGLNVLAGTRGAPALFASPADARFLCGSRLPSAVVLAWLYLSKMAASLVGVAWSLFVGRFFILRHGVRPVSFLSAVAVVVCCGAAAFALRLPVHVAARRGRGALLRALGPACALGGLAHLAWLAWQVRSAASLSDAIARLADGARRSLLATWFAAGFAGDLAALACFAVVALLASAAAVRAGRDVYPELWSASSRAFIVRAASRRGPGAQAARALLRPAARVTPSEGGARAPGGAWIVLWRDWLALRRSRFGLAGAAAITSLAVAAGIVAGRFVAPFADEDMMSLFGVLAGEFCIFFSLFTAARMGMDLRRPIWWLSAAPLRWRLAARNVSTVLAWGVPVWAFLAATAIASGQTWMAAISLPLLAATLWLVQAIAMAAYAVIPAAADMRGPGTFLRVVTLLVCLVPAVVAGFAGWALAGGVGAAGLASAVAVLEGWGMIAFAAGQIAERGHLYAAAETR